MKVCISCKVLKSKSSDFSINSRRKDGYNTICKECKNTYNVAWYQRNKDEHKKRNRINNKKYKDLAYSIVREKKSKPCKDCGISYPYYVMDFDHLPGFTKQFCIATAISRGRPISLILKEIEKCDVVCANCHRIRTFNRTNIAST